MVSYHYWNTTHRLSNSYLRDSLWQSRMRSRCMKMAFQTPSSTSCNKSTTTMSNMLNPKWPRRSENAFYEVKLNINRTLYPQKDIVPWTEQRNALAITFLLLRNWLLCCFCIWCHAQPWHDYAKWRHRSVLGSSFASCLEAFPCWPRDSLESRIEDRGKDPDSECSQ